MSSSHPNSYNQCIDPTLLDDPSNFTSNAPSRLRPENVSAQPHGPIIYGQSSVGGDDVFSARNVASRQVWSQPGSGYHHYDPSHLYNQELSFAQATNNFNNPDYTGTNNAFSGVQSNVLVDHAHPAGGLSGNDDFRHNAANYFPPNLGGINAGGGDAHFTEGPENQEPFFEYYDDPFNSDPNFQGNWPFQSISQAYSGPTLQSVSEIATAPSYSWPSQYTQFAQQQSQQIPQPNTQQSFNCNPTQPQFSLIQQSLYPNSYPDPNLTQQNPASDVITVPRRSDSPGRDRPRFSLQSMATRGSRREVRPNTLESAELLEAVDILESVSGWREKPMNRENMRLWFMQNARDSSEEAITTKVFSARIWRCIIKNMFQEYDDRMETAVRLVARLPQGHIRRKYLSPYFLDNPDFARQMRSVLYINRFTSEVAHEIFFDMKTFSLVPDDWARIMNDTNPVLHKSPEMFRRHVRSIFVQCEGQRVKTKRGKEMLPKLPPPLSGSFPNLEELYIGLYGIGYDIRLREYAEFRHIRSQDRQYTTDGAAAHRQRGPNDKRNPLSAEPKGRLRQDQAMLHEWEVSDEVKNYFIEPQYRLRVQVFALIETNRLSKAQEQLDLWTQAVRDKQADAQQPYPGLLKKT